MQFVELTQHLAAQNISDRDMEDCESDSSFKNPYCNRDLFWDHHGREKSHGELSFGVDLLDFFSTLQAKGFIN